MRDSTEPCLVFCGFRGKDPRLCWLYKDQFKDVQNLHMLVENKNVTACLKHICETKGGNGNHICMGGYSTKKQI